MKSDYFIKLCIAQIPFLVLCNSGVSAFLVEKSESTLQNVTELVLKCLPPVDICPHPNIKYFLYTRKTWQTPHQLDPINPKTIKNANFVEGSPLLFLIHGYTGNKDYSPNMELRPAYFKKGEFNIISLDWGPLAQEPCYMQSAHNVYLVAKCSAEFLDFLFATRPDIRLNNTHILGLSLGAHVAGLTGNFLKTGKVPRVTAFDPALPLFDPLTKSKRCMINRSAGKFVDVYHSNMGVNGQFTTSGDVDVHMNNGVSQPGCNCNSSCDHERSVAYFAESIYSPNGMIGFECPSWSLYTSGFCSIDSTKLVELGQNISPKVRGIFTVITNSAPPFLIPASKYQEGNDLAKSVDVFCNYISQSSRS